MAGNARGVHSRARLTYKRRHSSLLLFSSLPRQPRRFRTYVYTSTTEIVTRLTIGNQRLIGDTRLGIWNVRAGEPLCSL